MVHEKIQGAIEVLTEQLNQLLREVAEKKRVINSLYRSAGEEPIYQDVDADQATGAWPVRPDQFYGKPFATAAIEFLQMQKRACSTDDIVKGLEMGGFDFKALNWADSGRLRNVAISISKNTKTFHKLPNGYIGLLTWYPEVQKRGDKEDRQVKNGNSTGGAEKEGAAGEKEPDTDP